MVDWYIILFTFAVVIVFNLEEINREGFLRSIFPAAGFGMKKGTVLLWVSLFTQTLLAVPIFSTFQFGFIKSLFAFTIIFILAYLCVRHLTKRIQLNSRSVPALLEAYKNRLTPAGFKFAFFILLVANLEGLILQLSVGGHIFFGYFHMPSYMLTGLAALFCFIVAGLGGMHVIYRTGYSFLILCGFILFFIPSFFYLREGIHHVYQDYGTMLFPHSPNIFLFAAAFFMALIGVLISHLFLWQVICSIKENYKQNSVRLAFFCFSSVPLSAIIFTVYLLSRFHITTLTELGQAIFSAPFSPSIRTMITIVWLFSMLNESMISIYSLAIIFVYVFGKKWIIQNRKKYFFVLLLFVLLVLLCSTRLVNHIAYLWKIYFLFFVAVSLPFYALLAGKKRRTVRVPASGCIAGMLGYGIAVWTGKYTAGLAVTVAGTLIAGLVVFLTEKSKDLIK